MLTGLPAAALILVFAMGFIHDLVRRPPSSETASELTWTAGLVPLRVPREYLNSRPFTDLSLLVLLPAFEPERNGDPALSRAPWSTKLLMMLNTDQAPLAMDEIFRRRTRLLGDLVPIGEREGLAWVAAGEDRPFDPPIGLHRREDGHIGAMVSCMINTTICHQYVDTVAGLVKVSYARSNLGAWRRIDTGIRTLFAEWARRATR